MQFGCVHRIASPPEAAPVAISNRAWIRYWTTVGGEPVETTPIEVIVILRRPNPASPSARGSEVSVPIGAVEVTTGSDGTESAAAAIGSTSESLARGDANVDLVEAASTTVAIGSDESSATTSATSGVARAPAGEDSATGAVSEVSSTDVASESAGAAVSGSNATNQGSTATSTVAVPAEHPGTVTSTSASRAASAAESSAGAESDEFASSVGRSLTLTKVATSQDYRLGDAIEFRLEVRHDGPTPIERLEILEFPDSELRFHSASGDIESIDSAQCPIRILLAGNLDRGVRRHVLVRFTTTATGDG